MQYTEIKNPKWGNEEKTSIDCLVSFGYQNVNFIPFTAVPQGDFPYTHEIYARCLSGEFGEIGQYELLSVGVEIQSQDNNTIYTQPTSTGSQRW